MSSRAATPGKTLPSINSNDAPPPVDTWVKSSALQNFLAAETESPPPITDVAPFFVASTIASRTAFVPSANLCYIRTVDL